MDDDDDEVKITFMGGPCPPGVQKVFDSLTSSIRERLVADFAAANRKKFNRLVKSGAIRPQDVLTELPA